MRIRVFQAAAAFAAVLAISACGSNDTNQASEQNSAAVATEMHNQMTTDQNMAMETEMMGNHHSMGMGNMAPGMSGAAPDGMAPMNMPANGAQPMPMPKDKAMPMEDKAMPMEDGKMEGHM